MSLSTSDLTELMELWAELNVSAVDHANLSRVEALLCGGAGGHAVLLHVLSVLYVFIFLVGLAANGLVLWVNLRADRSRCETHLYVLNLAVADVCVVATLPVWVASLLQGGRWPFGEVTCKLAHLVFSVNLFSSIFFLTCMSVDRYLSVTLLAAAPHGRRRRAGRRLVCVLVWLLALAASAPDAYFLRAVRSPHLDATVCRPVYPSTNPREWMVGVQLSFVALGFVVPVPVLSVFYLLLAAAVPPGSDLERRSGRRVVLSYIVVFVACWLPFHSLLQLLPFSCRLEAFLDVALQLTQCLSLLHCCLNPVLYTFLHRGSRYHLMKAFIFKYSTKTGLARLLDGSQASETEHTTL